MMRHKLAIQDMASATNQFPNITKAYRAGKEERNLSPGQCQGRCRNQDSLEIHKEAR